MKRKILYILFGAMFSYFLLYFILNYNSTVVYTFSLNNDEFTLKDGIFVKSRTYNLLQLGVLREASDATNNIYRVDLYVGDKFIVSASSELLGNYYIKEKNGHGEYFSNEKIKNFKDNFKIKIYIPNAERINCFVDENNCTVKTYKLNVVEEFRNNNFL